MTKTNYKRLLQAVHIHSKRNIISDSDSSALDKVMTFPHPQRELAFLGWALKDDFSNTTVCSAQNPKAESRQISF